MAARQQGMIGNNQWSVAGQRNKDEQEDKDLRNRLMQGAAMAMKMNDKTALGYGLGWLLFKNWDKWFGGKGKSGENGDKNYTLGNGFEDKSPTLSLDSNGNVAVDYSNMVPEGYTLGETMSPLPMQQGIIAQMPPQATPAIPTPANQTIAGMNPQVLENAQGGYSPQVMPNLTLGANGVQGMESGANNTYAFPNFNNYNKAAGGAGIGSAWQMSNNPNNGLLGGIGPFDASSFDSSALSGAATDVNKAFDLKKWLEEMGGVV